LPPVPFWHEDGFVFTTPIGTPFDGRNMTRWFHDLCARAGIERRRFHALRHSAATLMLAQGVPLEVISRTLGHACYAITAAVYAHLHEGLHRVGAEAIDRALNA
jgi:integrase